MADSTLTAASVLPTANTQIAYGTTFEAITAGQPVYADSANSYKLRVAGNGSIAASEVVGIALNSAAAGQPLAYATGGDLTVASSPALVLGTVYALGNGAGTVSPAGDLEGSSATRYATILGVTTTATNLRLAIAFSDVKNP